MKRKLSYLIGLIAILLLITPAPAQQDSNSLLASGDIKIFAQTDNGQLTPIDPLNAVIAGRGLFRNRTAFELTGDRAAIRMKTQHPALPINFILEITAGSNLPTVSLIRLQPEQARRLVLLGNNRALGNAIVQPPATIPFELVKQSDTTFELMLRQGLPPGEYGFAISNTTTVYGFGIDGQ